MRRASPVVNAGFFALIVLVPLAWTRLFNAEFTLAKLTVLNAALVVAAWGVWLRPEVFATGETVLDGPSVAGLIVLCLAAAASQDPATSLRGRYDSYAYGLWGAALWAAAGQLAARGARGREAYWACWLTRSAALVAAYAVLQKFGVDPVFHLKSLPNGGRAVSTLGSPVDLSALLALAFPISLWVLDVERRPAAAGAAGLIAAGLWASGSRGAALAAGVGAFAYYQLSRRPPNGSLRTAGAAAVAAAVAAIAWTWRSGASAVDVGRREVWLTACKALVQRPWLGWGPDGFEDAFRRLRGVNAAAVMGSAHRQAYPHNDWLQVLAGAGIIGAAAYAWLLVSLARGARRALEPAHTRALAAALAAGLLALWVNTELNPVALEVLVFAALAAGLLSSLAASTSPRVWTRKPLFAAGILATASLFYCLRLAGADASFKSGMQAQASGDFAAARIQFARARASAPCELAYILGEVNALGDWINATHDVRERLLLLSRADENGRAARSCHPNQVNAPYIAGAVARMRADLGFNGFLAIAAREYDEALALDPMFEPLLVDRLALARRAGDAAAVERLGGELARVRTLKAD